MCARAGARMQDSMALITESPRVGRTRRIR